MSTRRDLRGALTLLIAVLAALALVPEPAGAAVNDDLWALTLDETGDVSVVRGRDAQIAVVDDYLNRSDTRVLTVEEKQKVSTLGDPLRAQQWALNVVPFERAHAVADGRGVTVAVVDTGVLASHQDLAGRVVDGIDLAADAARRDPQRKGKVDPGGHGTHVAGIIAATPGNNRGIAGAAPGVKIMPIRVIDASGSGTTDDVAEGIIWAAKHGARIINLSLGGGPSEGIRNAIRYARTRNATSFAAAGNYYGAGNTATYPAAYPEAVAVGAIDHSIRHATFSNTGSYVDVVAPGDNIWSTYGTGPDQYAAMIGTSAAAPYAAAVGALVLSANRSLTSAQLVAAVTAGTTDLGARGRDDVYGRGLVNPLAALRAASRTKINSGTKGTGYWVVSVDGRVTAAGNASHYGDLRNTRLTSPVVASARTPTGKGYWLTTAAGAVYSFGDARYQGSMGGKHLNSPIVGMAVMPTGWGYILLGQDGGIFTFGNARFYGSTGNIRLKAPVRDLASTADGKGYWFVAADGGVFSFGNAKFYGSTGAMRLASPVRSMTAARNGTGYWLVADDGGIFAFKVPFLGSLPAVRKLYGWPYVSSVRMRALSSNDGYDILGIDGTVWTMGHARNWGSARGTWAVDIMLT